MTALKLHQLVERVACSYGEKGQKIRRYNFKILNFMLFLLLFLNAILIYCVEVKDLPSWIVTIADIVYQSVPGAEKNVMHSIRLRDKFKFIYAINFIFFVLIFLFSLFFSNMEGRLKKEHRTKTSKNALSFYVSHLFFFSLFFFCSLIFLFGLFIVEDKTLSSVPNNLAKGASLAFKMYETKFGALVLYSLVNGWCVPFLMGLILHALTRFLSSLFSIAYILFKRKL